MSDGIAGATPLEEQIDDVRAVIDAAGSEQPVLISMLEGCALTALFAASHPDLVRALVLISPQARLVRRARIRVGAERRGARRDRSGASSSPGAATRPQNPMALVSAATTSGCAASWRASSVWR